jgi:hypothetical protein
MALRCNGRDVDLVNLRMLGSQDDPSSTQGPSRQLDITILLPTGAVRRSRSELT